MTPANTTEAQVNSYVQLALVLEPLLVPLVKDIAALFKAHPALTPDMLASLVGQIHSANAETLAIIAAYESTHPQTS